MSLLARVTATGLAVTRDGGGGPIFVHSITLTPAAATATVVVDDSVDGAGADLLGLSALASGASAQWVAGSVDGALFLAGVYVVLTGAGAVVTIEHS